MLLWKMRKTGKKKRQILSELWERYAPKELIFTAKIRMIDMGIEQAGSYKEF